MPYNVNPNNVNPRPHNGEPSIGRRGQGTFYNYPTDLQTLYDQIITAGSDRPGFFESIFDPESVFEFESAQNAKLSMMMADYNSPVNAMKRAQDAGINPNAAAGALAGGSSAEAPQPAQSAQGQAAKTLEGLLDAAAGGANAAASLSQASTAASIAPSSINLNDATARKALSDAGFSDASTDGILIDNYYKDSQHIADLAIKRQNVENMKMDWEYVSKQKEYLQKEIDSYDERIKAAIELQEKQALEAEKRAKEAVAHTTSMDLENNFFSKYGFHSDSPTDVALRNVWQLEGASERYIGMLDTAYNVHYNIAYGAANAAAAASWHSIPTSLVQSGWKLTNDGVHALQDIVDNKPLSSAGAKAIEHDEFIQECFEAKCDELFDAYKQARSDYRSYRYSGASDSVKAQKKQAMIDAKAKYDNFKKNGAASWLSSDISAAMAIYQRFNQ